MYCNQLSISDAPAISLQQHQHALFAAKLGAGVAEAGGSQFYLPSIRQSGRLKKIYKKYTFPLSTTTISTEELSTLKGFHLSKTFSKCFQGRKLSPQPKSVSLPGSNP